MSNYFHKISINEDSERITAVFCINLPSWKPFELKIIGTPIYHIISRCLSLGHLSIKIPKASTIRLRNSSGPMGFPLKATNYRASTCFHICLNKTDETSPCLRSADIWFFCSHTVIVSKDHPLSNLLDSWFLIPLIFPIQLQRRFDNLFNYSFAISNFE